MNLKLKAQAEIQLSGNPDFYLNDLNEITGSNYGTGKEYEFEGWIDIINRKFEIAQLFDYGNRNMIRPLITGRVIKFHNGYKLVLDFNVEGYLKTLFRLGLFVSILLPPLAYFFIDVEQLKWVFTLAPLANIVVYLQALAMFHYKVKDCLAKLNSINSEA